jgi:hypothetical protein
MGIKKGLINSKRYGAKVKLNTLKDKDITFYVTFKVGGKKQLKPVGKKSNGWSEKRAFEQRSKLIDKVKFGAGVHSQSVTVGELAVEYLSILNFIEEIIQKFCKHGISILSQCLIRELF